MKNVLYSSAVYMHYYQKLPLSEHVNSEPQLLQRTWHA